MSSIKERDKKVLTELRHYIAGEYTQTEVLDRIKKIRRDYEKSHHHTTNTHRQTTTG